MNDEMKLAGTLAVFAVILAAMLLGINAAQRNGLVPKTVHQSNAAALERIEERLSRIEAKLK